MIKLLISLGAVLALYGCTDQVTPAKEALELTLSRVNSVDYRDVQIYPGDVVCGEFDAVIRFGQHEGFRRFMVVGDNADKMPSEQNWAIYCNKDPAGEIFARFGVGPLNESNNTLLAVYQDMDRLDLALLEYLKDNLDYPLTHQGLEALLAPSDKAPKPMKFRTGGYIDNIPVDPWGRPYQYRSEQKLRMEPREYTLLTLGRDGAPGGDGEDTDISSDYLQYLRHLSRL